MGRGKVVTLRFDRKKDPIKLSKDILMVHKYMEYRDNGLLYESLFPTGIKYHPDIYYDFDSYMWRAMLPNGELCQGDLRSMVRMFTGTDIVYHYEIDGEEKQDRIFEAVVRDAVENPESFSIMGFQGDYSLQEWEYLVNLCEMLNLCRDGERYSGAKLEQWISVYVLLKTFCRSVRTRMPLFSDWGITLEEKYHVPERSIREIEYIIIRELITRLKKKNRQNTQQEPEKKEKDAKTEDSPTEIDSNNTFGS